MEPKINYQNMVKYVNSIECRMNDYYKELVRLESTGDQEMIDLNRRRFTTFRCSLNVLKNCVPELEGLVDSISLMREETGGDCH